MFDQIFGNYLVASGTITKEQFMDVLESEGKIRVKLGLIAVAEKLMTEEQADEVNKLQSIMDRRFGDIAVEKGYLSDDQVTQLLKKQGNIYMVFVQTLIDKGYMTLEEIDAALNKYQEDQGFTHSDMDALVSGDVDRTVQLFLPANTQLCDKHCGIAIRTFIRIIDSSAYVSKAYLVDELKVEKFAMQELQGDHKILSGFAADGNDLLELANKFAGEEFETVDLDALDAVGEFTNCINGLFASEMSGENVDLDMLPPVFYENPVSITGNQFCVFPIHVGGKEIKFILSIDADIDVK
ncbi:MAG: chemotaxis protein CheX [Lachnospiraceae bacterium]|nr:chemotaxis protein CheX [Lachnospiraceae bacterium]